jgi:hypothetical protein
LFKARGFLREKEQMMEKNSAWNSMNRAREVLEVAYLAAMATDSDSCRGLAGKLATLIDIIENEVDDAMMTLIPRDAGAGRQPWC